MSDRPDEAVSRTTKSWGDYFSSLWSGFKQAPSNLKGNIKSPAQIILLVLGSLVALIVVYWIFEKIFFFLIAKSYVGQLAEAFDLNKHLATAIVYLTFIAIAFFGGMIWRFSKEKRLIGILGIVGLLVAHSVAMYVATSRQLVSRKGEALKCYVITRDTVKYGEHPGVDPETGRQCRPISPEMVLKLREYEKGNRPKRIEVAEPTFFDLGTGEAIVWYYKNKNGQIELFDLMGFHPDTGDELLPVTKEIVDEWKNQKQLADRQAPKRIDPETYSFYDPITGKPRVWYRQNAKGDYEFYDRPGYDPLSGKPLTIITGDVIQTWTDSNGQRCYIIAPTFVRYSNHPGIDSETGRECRPLTPELLRRLREYEKGNRPKRIEAAEPTFFDLGTGEAIVWYYKNKNGQIELFDLMGFHPDTGDELLPVTKEIVDEWKNQKQLADRQAPKRVDPESYSFFDSITGKPRVWYQRNEVGDYEFYDRPGFHPLTGEPLTLVTRDVIETWRKYLADLGSQKCYIITPAAVKYGNHPGLDSETGRECRPVTAEMLRRLKEYEKGNRPKRITIVNPTFFDPGTGEPIVWYYKDKSGGIELFDLMGFDPQTGDELLPVTKEVVDTWKTQKQEDTRGDARPPERVDPDKYAFYDPVTGKPRVWYWRSESGDYEFYNNPGFQPRTGEKLSIITTDAIRTWKTDQARNEQRRIEADRRQQEEQRRRAEQIEKDKNAALLCDQLGANPHDARKAPGVPGVPYDALKYQAGDAIAACNKAVQQYPNELRFQYQLARALEFNSPDKALELQLRLGQRGYPAAYDNAGGIYLRKKNYTAAAQQFQQGAQHGDSDAMISLAEMIKQGRVQGNYIALYQRAASLGNEDAQQVLQQEQQRQLQVQQQSEQLADQQRRAMQILGTVLRNIRIH